MAITSSCLIYLHVSEQRIQDEKRIELDEVDKIKTGKTQMVEFLISFGKTNLRKSFQSKDLAGLRDLFTSRMSATQIATKNRNIFIFNIKLSRFILWILHKVSPNLLKCLPDYDDVHL